MVREQKLEKYSASFLRVVNCVVFAQLLAENKHPWWNLILWTTLLPSTWPKVYSKFHYVMFSQELIWSGGIYYMSNIVVSRLILKMKREDTFLEKWCVSLHFHSVTQPTWICITCLATIETYQSRPRRSRSFRLLLRTIDKSPLRRMIPKICYLCMLFGSEVYSIVTYLLLQNLFDGNIATTGACAVVKKTKMKNILERK